jgi:hypothetical protein
MFNSIVETLFLVCAAGLLGTSMEFRTLFGRDDISERRDREPRFTDSRSSSVSSSSSTDVGTVLCVLLVTLVFVKAVEALSPRLRWRCVAWSWAEVEPRPAMKTVFEGFSFGDSMVTRLSADAGAGAGWTGWEIC